MRFVCGSIVIAGLLAGAVLPGTAAAGSPERREKDKWGTTLWARFDQAPFPAKGSKWTDNSVAVFVPRHFCPSLIRVRRKGHSASYVCYSESEWKRLGKKGYSTRHETGVDYVVHFHGHSNTVAKTFSTHRLREQFSLSLQNAVLVVPQGPVNAVDSDWGKLESAGGFRKMVQETHTFLQAQGMVGKKQQIGRVIITSHSGGYKAAAMSLKHGGIEVSEVFLFDSLYAYADVFFEWISDNRQDDRRLINVYYRKKPRARSRELMKMLKAAGVRYTLLSDRQMEKESFERRTLSRARVLFVETELGHSQCTRENFNFRDYLFSSRLRRVRSTDWFKKHGLDKMDLRR